MDSSGLHIINKAVLYAWGVLFLIFFALAAYAGVKTVLEKQKVFTLLQREVAELQAIEESSRDRGAKNQAYLELAFSHEGMPVFLERTKHPDYLVSLINDHIESGDIATYPLSEQVYVRAHQGLCERHLKPLDPKSDDFSFDLGLAIGVVRGISDNWILMVPDLYEKSRSCVHIVQDLKIKNDAYERDKRRSIALEIGEGVGQAAGAIGRAWDGLTSPITKFIDDLGSGYRNAE